MGLRLPACQVTALEQVSSPQPQSHLRSSRSGSWGRSPPTGCHRLGAGGPPQAAACSGRRAGAAAQSRAGCWRRTTQDRGRGRPAGGAPASGQQRRQPAGRPYGGAGGVCRVLGAPLRTQDWPPRSVLVARAQPHGPASPSCCAIPPCCRPFNFHRSCRMSYKLDANMPPGEVCPLSVPQLMQPQRGLE